MARLPNDEKKPGLQPNRLRVQAALPDILHDCGHPGGIRIVYNLDQMGVVGTVARRKHAVAMANLIFDGFQRRLVKDFVYVHDEIGHLHGVLLAKIGTPCAGDDLPGQTQNVYIMIGKIRPKNSGHEDSIEKSYSALLPLAQAQKQFTLSGSRRRVNPVLQSPLKRV